MQHGLWLAERIGKGQHTIRSAFHLTGDIDESALQRAFAAVLARHDALRTGIAEDGEGPFCFVVDPPAVRCPVIDLRGLPSAGRRSLTEDVAATLGGLRFRLDAPPLIRMCIIRVDATWTVLWIAVHHLVFDEASSLVFCRELLSLYRGEAIAQPAMRFSDYAAWLRCGAEGDEGRAAAAFWQDEFLGLDVSSPLDDVGRRLVASTGFAEKPAARLRLTAQETGRLTDLCGRFRCTPFVLLLGTMQLMLARYASGQEPAVCIAAMVRPDEGAESLIGLCLNMLLIRAEVDERDSLATFFAGVRDRLYRAWSHRLTPFSGLADIRLADGGAAVRPLQRFVFSMQSEPDEFRTPVGGVRIEPIRLQNPVVGASLSLSASHDAQGIDVALESPDGSYSAPRVEAMLSQYLGLLRSVLAAPDLILGRIALEARPPATQPADVAANPSVYARFLGCCARHPDRPAIYDPDPVSFAELQNCVDRLAALFRDAGIGGGDVVALALSRSRWIPAAQLALLAIGAGFLPLSKDWPISVVREICVDVRVALTDRRSEIRLPPELPRLDVARAESTRAWRPPQTDHPSDAVAFVLCTSGSTGRPKGVAVSRGNLDHFVSMSAECLAPDRSTIVAATTPLIFDMSLMETILPAALGFGSLMLARLSEGPDHPRWNDVTWLVGVPTTAREIVQAECLPAALRGVILGGEPLDRELVDKIRCAAPDATIFNAYGPTEATVFVTTGRFPDESDVYRHPTIGKVNPGCLVHILDRNLNALPPWAIGQIAIGGSSVSHGYLRHADSTAARFVPDPLARRPGGRLHLTGDLAVSTPDGVIHLLGRIDQQVKISGERLDIAGVEAILRMHPGISDAACFMVGERTSTHLRAVVIPDGSPAPDEAEVRAWAAERLPSSHVPRHVDRVERFPRTSSGKIDRPRLRSETSSMASPDVPVHASQAEMQVLALWTEIIGAKIQDVDVNFFDAGGSSLHIPRMWKALRDRGAELTMRDLLRHTTARQQAQLIAARPGASAPPPSPADERPADALRARASKIRAALQAGKGRVGTS